MRDVTRFALGELLGAGLFIVNLWLVCFSPWSYWNVYSIVLVVVPMYVLDALFGVLFPSGIFAQMYCVPFIVLVGNMLVFGVVVMKGLGRGKRVALWFVVGLVAALLIGIAPEGALSGVRNFYQFHY